MKIYSTYREQLAHAAEEGVTLFPVTDEEKAKFLTYFKHPEPKDAQGMRELARYMGTTFQENAWEVDGHQVWVGDVCPDPHFMGVLPGCPIIVCGSSMALDPDRVALSWHEAGHLNYDPAKAPDWILQNPADGMFSHWGPKAARHEEQADHYACIHGYGEGLLRALKRAVERLKAMGLKYFGDTLDRIARIEHYLATGEWVDDGLERLPTNKEIREAASKAGVDAFTISLCCGRNVTQD